MELLLEADRLDGGDEPGPAKGDGHILGRPKIATHPVKEVPLDQADGHIAFSGPRLGRDTLLQRTNDVRVSTQRARALESLPGDVSQQGPSLRTRPRPTEQA